MAATPPQRGGQMLPRLAFTAGDWRAFLRRVNDGRLA